MTSRSLETVLQHGEIVRFKTGGVAHDAYYEDGLLHLVGDTEKKTFKTPSAFAMNFMNYRINGWKDCKVLREDCWISLNKLPICGEAPTIKGEKQNTDKMPAPRKKPVASKETVAPEAAKKPAATTAQRKKVQQELIASIVEPAEPALEISSVVRIKVSPFELGSKKLWRNYGKEKLFEQTTNGGVGAYVGRYNRAMNSIDTDVPDSDVEL